MEAFIRILIPAALCLGILRLCLAQVGLIWKVGINALAGFACLFLLNLLSGYTGILFPINLVTAAIAGFLGLPGIGVLALAPFIL